MERREYLSISWLKTNILFKKQYEQSDAMNFGNLVDCLFYTPELFNSKYLLYEGVTDKTTDLINELQVLDSFEVLSNKLAVESLSATVKKEETKLLNIQKFNDNFLQYKDYFELKKQALEEPNRRYRKQIVSKHDLGKANHVVSTLKESVHFKHLQSLSKEHHYQFDKVIPVEISGIIHNFKVILDHLIVCHDKCIIVDLKWTDSPIEGWHFIADKLRYDCQLAFYKKAIETLYGLPVECYWLVYSSPEDKTALFEASSKMLQRGAIGDTWKKGFIDLINIYEKSHENGYEDYNYEYNSTNGFLKW
jgi:hypothetical protein